MSRPPSATPTPQPASPSNTSPTSRRQTHEPTPTAPLPSSTPTSVTVREREESFTRPSQPPLPSTSSEPSSSRRRLPSKSPEPKPMAKRMRRQSPEVHAGERHSSRSSMSEDSQGGMADTEGERTQFKSYTPPPPDAPPKKKRTRTLTTPHQSAVLHALLAQSRFPTTAMREEVGRSIGLSARKVQIWFQNQRQKARRPRSQVEPQPPRPPQYGPFPNVPYPYPPSADAPPPPIPDMPLMQPPDEGTYYPMGRSFQEHYSEQPVRLSGPGMPGHDTRGLLGERRESFHNLSPTLPGPSGAPHRPQIRTELSGHSYLRRSSSPVGGLPYAAPYPGPMTQGGPGGGGRIVERDASRTLPPLIFRSSPTQNRPPTPLGPQHDPFGLAGSSPTLPPIEYPLRSPTPLGEGTRVFEPVRRAVPPPFTLQPAPQWEPSLGARPLRASHSPPAVAGLAPPMAVPVSQSAPIPGPRRIFSDEIEPVARAGSSELPGGLETSRLPSQPLAPSSWEARFDPVRSTFVPVRRTPSPLSSSSIARPQGHTRQRSSSLPSPSPPHDS